MSADVKDHLAHYGILRKSGRYPWGSGGTQNSRNRRFLDEVDRLRGEGLSEAEIARGFGITTTQLRAAKSIALTQQRQEKIAQAERLKQKGYSNVAIGQRMGINESSVRALLAPGSRDKTDVLQTTSEMLKREVESKKYVDIGHGVELGIGLSSEKLRTAVAMLQEEGYKIHYVKVQQIGTGKYTTRKVLSAPDVPYSEVYKNRGQIKLINESSDDGGRTFTAIRPPISISSKRIAVKYAEDGGADADGVIYLRRNAEDLSLGKSHYAQVRIAVDGTHYLKGMAIHRDDLPPGVDVVFNTNKSNTGLKSDAFKPFEKDVHGQIDKVNPFGADIKRQRGALNIINEEGDWDTWSRNLSSQVLSKQSPTLARTQLAMTFERRKQELADISALTEPSVRKKLLETFADETDAASVHLKAAALPGQSTRIILPVRAMSPNEIYAPTYPDGTRVALIRFPHAGTFEIPELTVNNRNREARNLLGTSTRDAVGIHPKVAERLSGADFDGDFVIVVPNNNKKIKSSPALEGLKNFDPRHSYPYYEGMTVMSKQRKQHEMGEVTNLIADMSLRGATHDEMARAVRHSMVVIDAEKHKLDYQGSARANGISALKDKYQKDPKNPRARGASTIITRATSEKRVPERTLRKASEGGPIDPVTGKLVYVPTGATYVNKKGKTVFKTTKTTKLADTDDAHTLSSGHPMEAVYADHSNRLKAMANQTRLEALRTIPTPVNKEAKARHAGEVASLNAKLNIAKKNAPLERQAQSIAETIVSQKRQAYPDLEPSQIKKIRNQALAEARARTGAGKQRIQITDAEWEAIQSGAVAKTVLKDILDNADLDRVRQLATPRVDILMTPTKTARAKAMAASGATQAEIAAALGVSLTTLKNSINE
jgi:DNA-binding CsgD family transcriptional regulator